MNDSASHESVKVLEALEPIARSVAATKHLDDIVTLSFAISLKRIADSLDKLVGAGIESRLVALEKNSHPPVIVATPAHVDAVSRRLVELAERVTNIEARK